MLSSAIVFSIAPHKVIALSTIVIVIVVRAITIWVAIKKRSHEPKKKANMFILTTIAVAIVKKSITIKAAIEKSLNIVEIDTAFADKISR